MILIISQAKSFSIFDEIKLRSIEEILLTRMQRFESRLTEIEVEIHVEEGLHNIRCHLSTHPKLNVTLNAQYSALTPSIAVNYASHHLEKQLDDYFGRIYYSNN